MSEVRRFPPAHLALALLVTPLLAAAAQAPQPAPAPEYEIDPSHSTAAFSVRHFTVSNVRGKFGKLSGVIRYDPDDLAESGVMVTIDAATIDTDHEQRDNHLKSADFLYVEEHPEITFVSSRVETGDDGFILTGDLTIRGVTREVSFPFTLVGPIKDPLGLMRIGGEGELTIDRTDFGLEWNRLMETGGVFVGEEVAIELSVEATRPAT